MAGRAEKACARAIRPRAFSDIPSPPTFGTTLRTSTRRRPTRALGPSRRTCEAPRLQGLTARQGHDIRCWPETPSTGVSTWVHGSLRGAIPPRLGWRRAELVEARPEKFNALKLYDVAHYLRS